MQVRHAGALAGLWLGFGLGGPALADPPAVQNVPWVSAPTVADLAAAFPAGARRQRIAGSASLGCVIGRDGRVRYCDVITEAPRFLGFAGAARRLSTRFRAPVEQPSRAGMIGARTLLRFSFPVEALDATQPAVGHPTWATQPHGDIPGSGYPRAAANAGVTTALVHLRCTVGSDGHLTGCTAVDEDPPGYGFGQAATALATGFVMTLWTDGGLPTAGASVTIPVRYTLPRTTPQAGR